MQSLHGFTALRLEQKGFVKKRTSLLGQLHEKILQKMDALDER
jgi:hypothetical protein